MAFLANNTQSTPGATISASSIWAKVSQALRHEMGDAAFGSWLAPAALRPDRDGTLCLVTQTGIARDWVRRHALRRIGELWAAHDPEGRVLSLRSRGEFDVADDSGGAALVADATPIAEAVSPGPAPGGKGVNTGALQDRFAFDTFVPGASNEFAHAVARRVASWADGHFNPVVLHGPYGFGKTHLLNAIAWEAMTTAPRRKVVYLTAERFLSCFVRALMDRKTAAFKEDFRSVDLLLIDDVQFIGGKHSTQEELFHTLAALMEDGRRVVFAADRPPSALTEIDARLRSHLSAGLVCGIEPADRALRLGILERKAGVLCRQYGFAGALRPDVAAYMADRFTESVRELEGALNTLIARAGSAVSALSLGEAQALLRPHLRGAERRITVDEIQKAVAEHFGMKQADLCLLYTSDAADE